VSVSLPNWKLPVGVSRGTWDYLQSESIARDYDRYFSDSPLMQLDQRFIQRYLPPIDADSKPPMVADFGCGTGRISRLISPLGYRLLNIDLSPCMLDELKRNCQFPELNECICANLVELDFLEPESLSMAVCLFSSLGMIRGRENRRRFLRCARAALAREAPLIVHVHNRYHSLWHPSGPSWLAKTWLKSFLRGSHWEFGDRVYVYRGLPSMFLHIYSRRELIQDLRSAGFARIELFPIDVPCTRLIPDHFLASLQAGGFLAVARWH
jgi:SAM-dependent methyltransferase